MSKRKSLGQRINHVWVKMKCRLRLPLGRDDFADALTIELTNRCTLACSCCPNGVDQTSCRPKQDMAGVHFERLLERIDIPLGHVFLHLHGEPFLNTALPDMAERLRQRGVRQLSIFSNAYHINLEILKRLLEKAKGCELQLCFSAELYDKQVYERIRKPGHFETIWQSMEAIDRLMSEYKIGYSLNSIVDSKAIDVLPTTVPDIFRRLQQLNNIHFSSAFPWPHLPATGDIAGHLAQRRPICAQIRQLPVVLSSGEVSMCSSDYRGECVIGSLWEQPYSVLMNSKKALRFRRNIALRRPERNQLCNDCLLDRCRTFSRTVRRAFIEKADETAIRKHFSNYHQYFDIDNEA